MRLSVRTSRAFTLAELLLIIVVVLIIAAVLLPAFTPRNRGHRQIRDSSQVRGIVQAMAIWAGNNKDQYPLPSAIDKNDDTVALTGRAKDTTANIMSIMVYNGSVPTDILISPAEANGNIQQYTTYEFNEPTAAVRPAAALWDPGFNADFTGTKPGGLSYSHLVPTSERLSKWTNSFAATEAILGNRGPEIASVTKKTAPSVVAAMKNPDSYTLLIHGSRTAWEGNIGFNDAHVDFNTTYANPEGALYTAADGRKWTDVHFYDEPDDPSLTNSFLGIFTTGGSSVSEFKAIWD